MTRNTQLIPGVPRLSRTSVFTKKALFKRAKATKTESKKTQVQFSPSETPIKKSTRKTLRKSSLRNSLIPGTVLILLSGRFAGKRVVLLKALNSGLLLVSGPYKINGVPLRRVNPAYVIATSTKIDISAVDVSKVDDAFFKKSEEKLPATRVQTQKQIDTQLLPIIKKTPLLKQYLNASFTLTKGQAPHLIKF